jgi:hypothetical protein
MDIYIYIYYRGFAYFVAPQINPTLAMNSCTEAKMGDKLFELGQMYHEISLVFGNNHIQRWVGHFFFD